MKNMRLTSLFSSLNVSADQQVVLMKSLHLIYLTSSSWHGKIKSPSYDQILAHDST